MLKREKKGKENWINCGRKSANQIQKPEKEKSTGKLPIFIFR
jgi:hypothetical protein